jgi:site-specific recombinase XerD
MNGDRPFSEPEFADVVARSRTPRDAALIQSQRWTGLRISEILLLTTAHVARSWSAVNDMIWIYEPKTKNRRCVDIVGELRHALKVYFAWLAGRRVPFCGSRPLFFSPKNPRRSLSRQQAYNIVHAAAINAGLTGKIGTHSLRKTGAEAIYEYTKFDIKAVQAWLGHASVASTGRYVGFASDRKARAANQALGARAENTDPMLWAENA